MRIVARPPGLAEAGRPVHARGRPPALQSSHVRIADRPAGVILENSSGMYARRELRVRVLEALERIVKQFRTREELYPLRVPVEPVAFDDVLEQALGDGWRAFDPVTLRSRTLLHLDWDDGSAWELWVIVLPSGLKLFCDSGEEESRILASGGRNLGEESDRLLLQLLAESAGSHFGIEMSGGAPSRVRSCIADRTFLTDTFVDLFEGTSVETHIREQFAAGARAGSRMETSDGRDFRGEVEAWLERVLG